MSRPPTYSDVVDGTYPTFRKAVIRPEQIQFEIDLLSATQREAYFLRMIDRKVPILYEDEVVRNAVRRYERYWLPLQVNIAYLTFLVVGCVLSSIALYTSKSTVGLTHA